MTTRNQRVLIFVFFIVAISVWIVLPNNPGIHILGIEKDIKIRLGLDLVGGVAAFTHNKKYYPTLNEVGVNDGDGYSFIRYVEII